MICRDLVSLVHFRLRGRMCASRVMKQFQETQIRFLCLIVTGSVGGPLQHRTSPFSILDDSKRNPLRLAAVSKHSEFAFLELLSVREPH